MITTEQERAKYNAIWHHDAYRTNSPGMRELNGALAWMKPKAGASFTDYGCGTGRVAHVLHDSGHPVQLVDISNVAYTGELPFVEACLWEMGDEVKPSDYGYCADVLEHVPPERVQAVLDGLASRTRTACFLQIALFEDHFGDEIGEALHLSVFPHNWWRKRILRSFKVASFRLASKGRHLLAVATP